MLFPKASALNTFFDTTGGITVNKKLNLKGRFALITSILLLTLWAPSTIYAESNATPWSGKYIVTSDAHECAHCKLLHSAKGHPCPHSHQHSNSNITNFENLVGFAEVDPATGLFENLGTDAITSSHEVSRDHVGFAESDPTDSGALADLSTPQLVGRTAWQNPVGFGETEPVNIQGALEVDPNEIFVACQHMGTSSLNPPAIEFSGPTSLEDHS